jgi:hypothetical protein
VTPPAPVSSTDKPPGNGSNPKVAGTPSPTSPGITAAASSTVAGSALPGLLVLAILSGLLAPLIIRFRGRRGAQ